MINFVVKDRLQITPCVSRFIIQVSTIVVVCSHILAEDHCNK